MNLNRCTGIPVTRKKPFVSQEESTRLRSEVDTYITKKMAEWKETVPYGDHFESSEIHKKYYERSLIETGIRIRLLRVAESKTLSEIAKISPESAQIWANYEMEEMLHDQLFFEDAKKTGATQEQIEATEPYLATKLLAGFFSYLLEHEGPLGVVVYSYLVETVNVQLDPKKVEALKKTIGESKIKGQISHINTDITDDHPGEVWSCLRHLIRSENDVQSIYRYIDEHQSILALFFRQIYEEIILESRTKILA